MERVERTGLGIAAIAHLALFALLSLAISPPPPPQVTDAIEVSFVDDVALDSASPAPATAPPPPSTAPELGDPEEAPTSPDAATGAVAPAAPAPAPAVAPPRESDSRDRRRPEEPRQTPGQRARAARLGDLNLDNLGRDPARTTAPVAPAAGMTAQAAASIAQAIARQVQPCADRQVYPGPGAERIVTSLRLRLNRDGSLQGRPVVAGQRGLDDENNRYAQRVADLAVNAFVSCAPLRGLPADLYAVPRGWSNFTMNYRLPG